MKRCTKCRVEKDVSEFRIRSSARDGLSSWCRSCQRIASRESIRRKRASDPVGQNAKNRAWYSGMTMADVELMVMTQGGGCAVCGDELDLSNPRKSVIDHDHACCSGKGKRCGRCNRGILCSRCNSALGLVRDDPEILRKMLTYLDATETEVVS